MKLNVQHFEESKKKNEGGQYIIAKDYEIDVNKLKKKDLIKRATELIKDIFDNYDKSYTNDEKEKIIRLINQMNDLNISLNHYDEAKKSFWDWTFGK